MRPAHLSQPLSGGGVNPSPLRKTLQFVSEI